MSTQRPHSGRLVTIAGAIALAALLGTGNAQMDRPEGLVETTFPTEAEPGMPFYARLESHDGHLYDDGEYAVIAFYRDPAGIPADFDLLTFFDPPAAFGAESLVTGSLWHEEPGVGSPYEARTYAVGSVPIWFVPVAALRELIEAGPLTISDLESIPGRLVGHAHDFEEVLHPHPLPPEMGGGGHPEPSLRLEASGTLEDGRRFEVTLTAVEGADGWQRTTVRRFH
jgi:hypothetical protein